MLPGPTTVCCSTTDPAAMMEFSPISAIIEQDRPDADQAVPPDAGTVYDHVMTDGDIVFDLNDRFFEKRMQRAAVLDVHPVADPDRVHIAPQHRIEPDGAVVANLHITNDCCILRQVTVLPDLRCEPAY
jgi:hypothetical protein